jgi:hypothetical protein
LICEHDVDSRYGEDFVDMVDGLIMLDQHDGRDFLVCDLEVFRDRQPPPQRGKSGKKATNPLWG